MAGPSTTTGPKAAITIQNFTFSPPLLSVAVGTAVTATNLDSTPHNWIGEGNKWDSGTLEQNKAYTYVFGRAGTFTYTCTFHPSMNGTVRVG